MSYALILHGWPQYRVDRYFLSNHLRKNGYKILTPNMFSRGYIFSPANVLNEVLIKLNNNELDLIIGISLGGLILPHIARHFPNSKLIFIGTGPKLESKSRNFNLMVKVAKTFLSFGFLSLLLKLPDSVIRYFYKVANPFTGDLSRKQKYDIDTCKNIKFIKSISLNEEKEILNFVTEVDNSNILGKLNNKSLIFNGENDLLMTTKGGKKLHRLLKNSKFVISKGSHFDSFTRENLDEVDKFIASI
ncbi:hypothetical protein A2159_03300 [Candidatus Woesebacteria bacterium RBG_13_34_9]|uniref:AB hydrolase-1 domain-containing protein n=1 Tax=Candidatus Woesebacteria bacterium RBG_13_34_9 TaxID=1802477 RepID=A0A1F7WZU0_9BACT|nr:MAG: hypothetical protein A2159_03300 [Candidatus Woesebacteria bacterium RBG_13_34_9]